MLPGSEPNSLKHALCLPGGGAKSGVQVGAFKRMLELGITPSLVAGTSGGCLNGALIAMGKYDLLFELWEDVGNTAGATITKAYLAELRDGTVKANVEALRTILTNGINLGDKIGLITKKGQRKFIGKIINNASGLDRLLDNSPLRDLLIKHVRKADFIVPFYLTLVSLYDGSLYTLRHDSFATDEDLALAVLASSAMPGIWRPIDKITLVGGNVIIDACDGGLRSSSPLPQIMANLTFEDEWVVWAINPNSVKQMINSRKKNIIVQAAASIDIMLNNGLQQDIKMTEKINNWALKHPEFAIEEKIKYAKIFNIEPPLAPDGSPLLGRTLDFRKEWIEKRMNIGYESVNSYFEKIS